MANELTLADEELIIGKLTEGNIEQRQSIQRIHNKILQEIFLLLIVTVLIGIQPLMVR